MNCFCMNNSPSAVNSIRSPETVHPCSDLSRSKLEERVDFWLQSLTIIFVAVDYCLVHTKVKYENYCHEFRDRTYDFKFRCL